MKIIMTLLLVSWSVNPVSWITSQQARLSSVGQVRQGRNPTRFKGTPQVLINDSVGASAVKLSTNVEESRLFMEYDAEEASCEPEMAHLDNYAVTLQNDPTLRAYVIVYAGRRDTALNEISARRARIKRYLTKQRAIDSKRVTVINGGFREKLTIELWLVPGVAKAPKAVPTISAESVRYKKSKYKFTCSTFY